MLLAIALTAWVAVLLLTAFVGLATTVAAVTVAIAALLSPRASVALAAYAIAMAALVAFAHRGNFARMRAGTEPRMLKLWLFRPRGDAR
jgi:glycerol-3-phosphate acyltransferase PlsY